MAKCYKKEPKVITTQGTSLAVTVKGDVQGSLNLEKKDNVSVEYYKNYILIKKV